MMKKISITWIFSSKIISTFFHYRSEEVRHFYLKIS